MVQVTAASRGARSKWGDKRRGTGRSRADFEEAVAYAPDANARITALAAYLEWETYVPKKDKKGKHSAPPPDATLARAVFERTVAAYGAVAGSTIDASWGEGGEGMIELAAQYKVAEAGIWVQYLDFIHEIPDTRPEGLERAELSGRAVRACPLAGETWVRRLDALERGNEIEAIDAAAASATELAKANSAPVAVLADIMTAHAGVLQRRFREPASLEHPVFLNLTTALDTLFGAHPAGDASLRLEKLLVDWVQAAPLGSEPDLDVQFGALAVLTTSAAAHAASYQMTILLACAHARVGDIDAARAAYTSAAPRWNLDWPEAVYEAWIRFESVQGTLDTVALARTTIAKEQVKVNRRRQKEAEKQQAEAAQQYAAAAAAAAAPVPAQEVVTEVPATSMDVDEVPVAAAVPSAAPAALVEAPAAAPAPAAEDKDVHVKRDREHTTILVTGLKKGTTEDRLSGYFSTWGAVREITLVPGNDDDTDTDSAMVEYRSADSIPAVLEKDRRKLDDSQIHVSMLWRSTLYVTNFARSVLDADLRELFGQYGKILQLRWPSRKYKDERRFCYVTLESPAAAQDALVLNGFKVGDARFGLSVAISDPAARKKRTDDKANTKLYISGLSPKTTEPQLRKLLDTYGTIATIRLPMDKDKHISKGFAFVDMATEAEAQAAAAGANGAELLGRTLKVEIADPNHKRDGKDKVGKDKDRDGEDAVSAQAIATSAPADTSEQTQTHNERVREVQDRRSRKVAVLDLPVGTQEGLLQQALEQYLPDAVRRVVLYGNRGEAVVELSTATNVGNVLMEQVRSPFVFNGATLRIVDAAEARPESAAAGTAAKSVASAPAKATPHSSLAFQPRPRKTAKPLGGAYVPPRKAAATAPAAVSGGGQDAFRAFMTATNDQRKDKLDELVAAAASKAAETALAPAAPASDAAVPEALAAGQKHALEEDAEGDAAAAAAKRAKRGDE
jgi:RNA recognition motif-containing protein